MAEHLEPNVFDKVNQRKYNPWRDTSQYAGLLETGDRKVSWRARFYGQKVRK